MPASITPYLPQLTQVQRGEAMRAYTRMCEASSSHQAVLMAY